MNERVAILGAGSWGMAVSHLIVSNGYPVTLWEFDLKDCRRLQQTRTNPDRLKGFELPGEVKVTNDLGEAITAAEIIVLALPAQILRSVLRQVPDGWRSKMGVINLAKGIEKGSLARMSQVIAEETGLPPQKVATLSGPSHAEEVVKGLPATVVLASHGDDFARIGQELFSGPNFRVYLTDDMIGVELGGSMKNIIAIATGIVDGLSLGDNTKGALLTRGLAEITRLGLAAGAQAETFAGLSGVGDLVTTCSSRHSRNRFVGESIARGKALDAILSEMTMVAEGVETARSGRELARKHDVEMPITEEVYQVLFHGRDARVAVENLMGRRLRAEIWQ